VSIATGNRISRALFSSSDYSATNNLAKPRAFLPVRDPDSGTLETSVVDTSRMSEADVWQHMETYVGSVRGDAATLRGRADIEPSAVSAARAQLRYDGGLAKHAAIVGWPAEKEEQKRIAVDLASAAILVLA
jgi:hypothetical protein